MTLAIYRFNSELEFMYTYARFDHPLRSGLFGVCEGILPPSSLFILYYIAMLLAYQVI